MAADLAAVLDEEGSIASWQMKGFTDAHSSRPRGRGDRLAPAWLRSQARPRPWSGPGETGARNAVPIYDIPVLDVV
ncbi:MAG: hypothetical protein GWN85_41190, partial [Gemmatimonadetes bacterium]|nr:hypothetical protein [Gemmatimonadota bacterium]NIR37943.1 hypothetical protein [Actinomycetota bacterium]NIS32495.1 hypothetical protein [Actinomycetota bacterium]NIU67513.1 hypothetical protein [Actinomycetota bacterium]NIW29270.1 hypothetical protein [Actinomycetota bacterium]